MSTGLLSPDRAADQLQLTPAELEERRRDGRAPGWIRLSKKTVRYHPGDVDAALRT